MNQQDEQEYILKATIKELYNYLSTIKDENNELEEAYIQARTGINLQFDIHFIVPPDETTGIQIGTDHKNGYVKIARAIIPIEEYWQEVQDRKDIMRKALLEYLEENETTIPRTIMNSLQNGN